MKRPQPKKRIIQDIVELRSRSHDSRIDPQATQKISRQQLDAVLRRSSGVRPRVERPDASPPANVEPEALEPEGVVESEAHVEAPAPAEAEIDRRGRFRMPTPLNPQMVIGSLRRIRPKRFVVVSVTLAIVFAALVGLLGFVLGRVSH